MNDKAQEIAKSGDVLGGHLQYLANNPRDFYELVKLDPHLAQRYAEQFSAGHVITLIARADDQKFVLLTEMLQYLPSPSMAHYSEKTFLPLQNQDEIQAMWTFVKSEITLVEYYDPDPEERGREYKIYLGNHSINEIPPGFVLLEFIQNYGLTIDEEGVINSKYNHKIMTKANVERLMDVYQNIKAKEEWEATERQRVKQLAIDQKNMILITADILLSKLDSSIWLTDAQHKKRGVLDLHFIEPVSSRFFAKPKRTNLFNVLIENKHYLLIGKVIALLSPKIAMYELHKPRNDNSNLLTLIISQIANARECAIAVLDKMAELPKQVFELLIQGFNFDVLYEFEKNCKQLARRFYELSPGFMQGQYPITAVDYVDEPESKLVLGS